MAHKDHSLDEKIIDAATAEFMEHGFQSASLRRIAARAGLSTGALYTRYAGKDALFCAIVGNVLEEISREFAPMREIYMKEQESRSAEAFLEAIRKEEQIYLDVMFSHYDQCILFFCRSEGSSLYTMIQQMMEMKAQETVAYFESIAKKEVDLDGIRFILAEQFHYFRQILQNGYSREKAISCMKTVEIFMEAGWKAFYEQIL